MHEKESIHEEIRNEAINDYDPANEPKKISPAPLFYIVAFFIGLSLILMVIPHYNITSDAEPRTVPSREELITGEMPDNITRPDNGDIRLYMDTTSPLIKQTSIRVATAGCNRETICQAKAIFYFVRDNFKYVGEIDQYTQTPTEMLYNGGGDCKDFSVLLASMQRAIGVPVRFVFVPGHVYVQIYIQDAPRKYKTTDGWIPLEATCSDCGFGEIPRHYDERTKRIVWAS